MLGNHITAEGKAIKAAQRFHLGPGGASRLVNSSCATTDTRPVAHFLIFIHCHAFWSSSASFKLVLREETDDDFLLPSKPP